MRAADSSWTTARLGDLLTECRYGTSSSGCASEPVPVVGIPHVKNGRVLTDCAPKMGVPVGERLGLSLRPGDILFARTNSRELVGCTGIIEAETDAVFASYLVRLRVDETLVDPRYLNRWLNSTAGRRQVERLITPAVCQANVNPTELRKNVRVPLPPLDEQRRIAATLATWDEAIEKTERLIHFADARLRGLTRRLVDARCNTWPHEHLDHVFRAVSRKAPNGTQPLSVTQDRGVVPRTEMERRIAASDQSVAAYKHMRQGDFVVSLRSFEGGLEHSEHEGGVSAAYTVLRPALSIDARFYKYFFKSDTFVGRYLAKSVVGIRDGKQIDMAGLLITAIPLPPIDEQRRIADVLDEARHEIDLLTRLKQRYELQRRGLEQRLLTPPDTQRAAS